ncbi:MAG: response regulator [Mesorhizobium sp.]|nr:response regulator [Mesorhizobium sp.]
MPNKNLDPVAPREDAPRDAIVGQAFVQPETVIVVSTSQVNLIVLSRIVERARLKAVNCEPERAGAHIARIDPLIVILDGGSDMRECDAALGPIAVQKRMSDGARPHVVLLTVRNMQPDDVDMGGLIDSLVAKPVTPERLQPLIETVRDRWSSYFSAAGRSRQASSQDPA